MKQNIITPSPCPLPRGERGKRIGYTSKMISLPKDDANINEICNSISEGKRNVRVCGLWGASRALFVLALRKRITNPIMVVSEREDASEAFRDDLGALAGSGEQIRSYVFSHDLQEQSLIALSGLCSQFPAHSILFTTISSMQTRISSMDNFIGNSFDLNTGQVVDYDGLMGDFSSAGYERVDMVSRPGEFSVRGQIIDVWSAGFENPARVVLARDKIEEIKRFDIMSQRSTGPEDALHIIPAKPWLDSREEGTVILDWLAENTVVILDNISSHSVVGGMNITDDIREKTKTSVSFIELSVLTQKGSVNYGTQQVPSFNADINGFFNRLVEWKNEGMGIHVFCNNSAEKSRLIELLNETAGEGGGRAPEVDFRTGSLNTGFVWAQLKLVVVTDAEIFNRYKIKHHWPKLRQTPADFTELSELNMNDFMVHERYGIGMYLGLNQMRIEDRLADYIVLEYAGSDKLYVPIEDFRLVQKYIGAEGHMPKLSSLDSTSWSQAKRRARKSVMDIAGQLLDVHAARQALAGHAFPLDSDYEKEFADAFIYELTPAQEKAIKEVGGDMAGRKPMDRIICGDVGYGKTEVAMRASLKAVLDGKQVAVLVPTTILAEQHYNTFVERFADYPVKIEMMSRFRSRKQQDDIVGSLKEGQVDILIGTHRILQKDIEFSDLGLVIIDEEHRFGVRHKEELKQLRKLVDILMLTATPIPRTLSMAMGKVKDLSVINTPPPERIPVETYVGEYDDDTVKVAINNEVNRGGQVFYIHDRVDTIRSVAEYLKSMLPGVRICHAHGQMPSRELEKIMKDFVGKSYDLLISTTIVESGLDIPNVNTIIISNAQKMGLAQLHQLRGRIGRDKYQAFCYLLYPRKEPLSEIARKRLMVIAQHTELGAGFKIALKDLQIRGAGNLLGSRQHGHIMDVGFDLYCKLLGQAVEEKKTGREVPEEGIRSPVEIDLPVDAFIPMSYVSSSIQRINIYRRLSLASGRKAIDEIAEELTDRYGEIPPECHMLFEIVEIRQAARLLEIKTIEQKSDAVVIKFSDYKKIKPKKFSRISKEDDCLIKLGAGNEFSIVIKGMGVIDESRIKEIKNILQVLT